ncbi:hypothetical protein OsI_30810 [Oryza sativa Indica Group]|uniref:Uncharacterized protein n=1 Tax=Oryza sativa subsp. indica TaxID=39946 RepID=B8BE76_ORYSI|nr:hypothetical protein OsI_30810 [Oryza sativa Indica Group]
MRRQYSSVATRCSQAAPALVAMMRDTSIVGIDDADNRTLQHVWSSGDGAESMIPLIQ